MTQQQTAAIAYVAHLTTTYEKACKDLISALTEGPTGYAIRRYGDAATQAGHLLQWLAGFRSALGEDRYDEVSEYALSEYRFYLRKVLGARSANQGSTCAWTNCVTRALHDADREKLEICRALLECLDPDNAPVNPDPLAYERPLVKRFCK